MRLRLKNTFVEVDLATVADTSAGGSWPSLLDLAAHGRRSPAAARARSADIESPSRSLQQVRTCPQLDRLNNILVRDPRQGFGWHDEQPKDSGKHMDAHGSCPSVADSEEVVASSVCSTESPGSAGSGRLKRQVWSFDFSSTAPSDPGHREYTHKDVPRRLDFESISECKPSSGSRELPTTLMIRNIPNRYTQQDLLVELEELGFAGLIDFLYMPRDKAAKASIGYAFVNFADGPSAQGCREVLSCHHFSRVGRSREALVSVAHLQGLEANRAHYEQSCVSNSRIARHRPLFFCARSST